MSDDFVSASWSLPATHEEVPASKGAWTCVQPEDVGDYATVVAELSQQSERIRQAYEAVKSSRAALEKEVEQARENVKKKQQELKLLNLWPLQAADDAKKWLDLCGSKFGKCVINLQSSRLAENTCIVDRAAQTVNHCRQFIYAKRNSHEEWRASTQKMRQFYESEIKRVQQEIEMLRNDVARWELCATKNELCVADLTRYLKQVQLELLKGRANLEELRAGKENAPTDRE